MKKILILCLTLLNSCTLHHDDHNNQHDQHDQHDQHSQTHENNISHQPIIVGATHNIRATWVYLNGLLNDFAVEIKTNSAILDAIGKRLGISFIIVPSKERCTIFDNKLCWPLTEDTYNYIQSFVTNKKIDGYVGFSNGAYFLSDLIQKKAVAQDVILIAAAAPFDENASIHARSLTVIVGTHDKHHYKHVKAFMIAAQKTHFPITYIEHDGNHFVPESVLESALIQLQQNTKKE